MANAQRMEMERRVLRDAQARGGVAKFIAYAKLSGPGWLQSAITLGGGSLAGSLYLGVLGGFHLLWLQILAMLAGVVMLSSIAYVTLSTGQRPFKAINEHINPVLGWGWAIATLMANIVWCLPQFSLATAAVRQNLFPGVFGPDSMPDSQGKLVVCMILLISSGAICWFYDKGATGIRVFESILKGMVGVVVLCFVGVVATMLIQSRLDVAEVLRGLIPDLSLLYEPAPALAPYLDAAKVASAESHAYWVNRIVSEQRDVIVTACATAVGINMTFLLPCSLLARGWDKDFRGLAVFDLFTGLLIPFSLASTCVVIAAATQFHTTYEPGLLNEVTASGMVEEPSACGTSGFVASMTSRLSDQFGQATVAGLSKGEIQELIDTAPEADRRLAAMLVQRDAFNLASTLEPLAGKTLSHYVFGVGVLGMAWSTIIMLMLISGFTVCEMAGITPEGLPRRLGCLIPGVGVLGPFMWGNDKAQFYLAVPASLFGMVLLPIAYATFFFMINNRAIMGEHLPRGGKRLAWNVVMVMALGVACLGAAWSIWSKTRWVGVGVFVAFVTTACGVHILRGTRPSRANRRSRDADGGHFHVA